MAAKLEQATSAYDELHVLDNRLTLQWYPQRVLDMVPKGSMLELGLGHGISTQLFAARYAPYTVIEGSPEIIARFRERFDLPQVDVVHAYFEDYVPTRPYDLIAMGFVLEHVEDPALVLRHYRRFVAPGGSVVVAVPNSESLHRRLGHLAGLLPNLEALSGADLQFGHRRYFNLASLSQLVQQCGYRIVTAEGLFLKPLTTGQIDQLGLPEEVLQALMRVGVGYPELCNSLLLRLAVVD